ncbi:unnamed protein product [Ectocarpus sp. 6 AP-2014]
MTTNYATAMALIGHVLLRRPREANHLPPGGNLRKHNIWSLFMPRDLCLSPQQVFSRDSFSAARRRLVGTLTLAPGAWQTTVAHVVDTAAAAKRERAGSS